MDELTARFEASRAHLRQVAFRMLGSLSEADDAVQEAWLRLNRADASAVANLTGWLTTVVARVCLDQLRSRKSRREEPIDQVERAQPIAAGATGAEEEATLADSVGPALLVVLETLAPAERIAFVLHDLFAVPFDEIARIVGRSPAAARQLASRARRRVQGKPALEDADLGPKRAVVDAFLAAARSGDFSALVSLLDPNVVARGDDTAVALGAPREVQGSEAVAKMFSGRAQAAQPALIDGFLGFVWAPGGKPRAVNDLTIENGKIVEIEMIGDQERIQKLDLKIFERAK